MSEHIIWNEIGTLHFNAGAYDQATKAYQRAIELGGDFSTAMQNLALTYVQEGELIKAVSVYKEALKLDSHGKDKAALWYHLSDIYSQLQDHENALQAYQKAAEIAAEQDESSGSDSPGKDLPSKNGKATPTPVSVMNAWPVVGPKTARIEMSASLLDGNQTAHVDEGSARVISADSPPRTMGLFQINIEQIHANPAQPRLHVDVKDLVESIRLYGIIQPLIIAPGIDPDRYILISGERRLEAARQVGLSTVPAIIRDADEQQRLELALIENVQRQNLSSLEQADGYAQLEEEYGLSPDQIAVRIGKSSTVVSNLLRLLELPEKIRRTLDAGRINEEHARALFLLQDETAQKMVLQRILDEDLSVRKTEKIIRALLKEVIENSSPQKLELDVPESEVPAVVELDIDGPEVDEPDLEDQLVKSESSAALAEVATEVEESVTATLAVTPAPSSSIEEAVDDAPSVEDDEKTHFAESQTEVESVPDEEDIPEQSSEDLLDDIDESLPTVIMPQTNDFSDPQQQLTDEQVRNRIITFKRVTEVNPNNDKAWSRLGNHYAHLGEDENAIEAYLRAIELAPNMDDYHYQLGQLYISQQKFEDAAKVLEEVVAIDENNVFAHCSLASCYRHLEMDEKADEHLEVVAPVMEFEKAYNQACYEAIRGSVIRSVELLRTALRMEQTTFEQIQNDSDFDFIRNEPVFEELMTETISVASS